MTFWYGRGRPAGHATNCRSEDDPRLLLQTGRFRFLYDDHPYLTPTFPSGRGGFTSSPRRHQAPLNMTKGLHVAEALVIPGMERLFHDPLKTGIKAIQQPLANRLTDRHPAHDFAFVYGYHAVPEHDVDFPVNRMCARPHAQAP